MAACCSRRLTLCSLGPLVLTGMMWFSSRTGWHQCARLLDSHRRALFSSQVQQRVARSAQAQSTVSMPVQTNLSLTMPFYSNPMMLSQTNTRSLQDANQRHIDDEFTQDGQLRWALHAGKQKYPSTTQVKVLGLFTDSLSSRRMLLNQPMQTLVPTSNVTSQPSQCNMGISQSM